MHTYRVTFYTGKLSWSGTNANVFLEIQGTAGESETFTFENEGNSTFESGMRNTFTVDTKHSLGNLTKLRVGHDNTGINPGWFLEKVEILDTKTSELSEFDCFKWFDAETGDCRIRRDVKRSTTRSFQKVQSMQEENAVVEEQEIELQANEEVFEEPPPIFEEDETEENDEESKEMICQYTMTFHTGEMAFAGTDANIFVTLYGKHETQEEFKFENKSGNSLFEKGMKNSFPIESRIPLENMTKLLVGHDNTGIFPGWYIVEIVIENTNSGEKAQFPCNQWLEDKTWIFENEITCLLTREKGDVGLSITTTTEDGLKCNPEGEPFGEKEYHYTIHVVSEVSYGSLSDEQIIFTLYGKNGHTEEQRFDQTERSFPKRARGTMELYISKDLGQLEKIEIGLDKNEGASPWILVLVVDHQLNETVVFICDCCYSNDKQAHITHHHFSVFVDAKNDVMALDKDDCDDWPTAKHTKDVDVRSRSANLPNTPPIIKAVLKLDDVPCPYKTAVKNFTDWEKRFRWDKTLSHVNVLEKIEDFTLVQCSLKMPMLMSSREVVLACLDFSDQRCYMQTMCNTLHPRALVDNKKIRAKTFKSGIMIHDSENESNSATITVVSQVELGGWIPPQVKADYLTNAPIKQLEFFREYVTQHKDIIKDGSIRERKPIVMNGI